MPYFKKFISKKYLLTFFIVIFLCAVAFTAGWFYRQGYLTKSSPSTPLRLSGFNLIKPVLLCNTNPTADFPQLTTLSNKLNDFINSKEKSGDVQSVSVYFQDFKLNGRVNVNGNETFRAASMGKVPIMIALYRIAESDPQFLDKMVRYTDGPDLNSGQEVKPKDYAKIGQTYTVEQLIEKMIKYSDNNSTYMLINLMGPDKLASLYQNLQVPFPVNTDHPENVDFITTRDMSYFFRILYNATYLSNYLSEKALEILSETDYKAGLVAGVDSGESVAHKFGLDTLMSGGTVQERELHDCGVVYHSKDPYLLCVMTKSSSNLSKAEAVISGISSLVNKEVDNYSK